MAKPRLDIHQHVTDAIIAQMEAGTPPWRTPWTGSASMTALPQRHNGEPYRGVNVLILWITATERGYASARWMTFKQAKALGGTVRKGESSTKTVYYGTYETETDGDGGETETRVSRFAKAFSVFNCDQIEGLPEDDYTRPEPPRDLGTAPDPALDAWFAATGAKITTSDEPRAYYRPATDEIHMPPIATFHDAARFYGVQSHELCHWSGAAHRLDRLARFADHKAYAFEELVAEIGACFLSVQLGIAPDFGQSAAYLEGWLEALKGDKTLIFKAAAEAQKAVDFLTAQVDENRTIAA